MTSNTSDLPKKDKISTTIKPEIILTTPESLIITNLAAPASIDSSLINFRCTTVAPILYIAKQPSTSLNSIVEHHRHYHQPQPQHQQPSVLYVKSDAPSHHFNQQNQSKVTIDSGCQTIDITDKPSSPSTANNSRFVSLINNKHCFSIAQKSKTLVMLGIVLIFLIDFVQFYLALRVVKGEEAKIHRFEQLQYRFEENKNLQIGVQPQGHKVNNYPDNIENKVDETKSSDNIDNKANGTESSDNKIRNGDEQDLNKCIKLKLRISKIHRSRALSMAIISLSALPLHAFGLLGLLKQSFSMTLTYSIISAVLLMLQLKSSANHRNMDNQNWVLWLAHLLLTLICIGYCFPLCHTKTNPIKPLGTFGRSLFCRKPPTPTAPLSPQFSNS